jgi:aldehyde:ferredoxin oxidoreductase
MGKILEVDLTRGEAVAKELDIDIAKNFIGDFGINARLAYDLIEPNTDPLSPRNVMIFGAGPLVGTRIPGAARCHILTKFPLTGSIWEAGGSMAFSTRLKAAGYDHLIITGRSDKPVYLHIFNDNVEICDANKLWGKGIFDTTDVLWDKYGKQHSVMAIGQAGENLVKISLCLIDKVGTAGKGGLGAVMGSKNLKAIAVNGSNKVKVYNPEKLRKLADQLRKTLTEDPSYKEHVKLAQMFEWEGLVRGTKCEYKNWTETYPREKTDRVINVNSYLKVKKTRLACPSCPRPDKDALEIRNGEYKGLVTYVSGFGGRARDLALRGDLESINQYVKCLDLVGQYGVCTHLFWSLYALAVNLYDLGIITKEDTGGLVLKRGFETQTKLIEQITFRERIGDVLADGIPAIIKKFGKECEKHAIAIKGEDPQRDGRAHILSPNLFASVVSPEGGGGIQPGLVGSPDHFAVGSLEDAWRAYCRQIGVPKEALNRIFDKPTGYNVGRMTKHSEEFYTIFSSLGLCTRHHYGTIYNCSLCAELYSAVTGIEMGPYQLKECAERAWNMLKVLNVKEGFTRKDDKVPRRWLEESMKDGSGSGEELRLRDSRGKVLVEDDVEKLLDDYYDEHGWEIERGIPSKEKLINLGLTEVATDFKEWLSEQ